MRQGRNENVLAKIPIAVHNVKIFSHLVDIIRLLIYGASALSMQQFGDLQYFANSTCLLIELTDVTINIFVILVSARRIHKLLKFINYTSEMSQHYRACW